MSILELGANLFGINQGIDQARAVGEQARASSAAAANNALTNTQFKPFAVTSNLGNVNVGSAGGFDAQLSPQQQALSDLLRTTGQQFTGEAGTDFQTLFNQNLGQFGLGDVGQAFNNVAGSVGSGLVSQGLGTTAAGQGGAREQNLISMLTGGGGANREQEVFDRLEALQAPSRERESLALENRLFGQGRSGVSTSMFGGTPEQLALNKAIEESRSQNALGALDFTQREQAQTSNQTLQALQQGLGETQFFGNLGLGGREQALREALGGSSTALSAAQQALAQRQQAGQLGLGFTEASFMPTQNLLDLLNPAANFANIGAANQRQGAMLAAELERAGIEASLNAEKVAGDMTQQRTQLLTNILAGNTDEGSKGLISGFLNNLLNLDGTIKF